MKVTQEVRDLRASRTRKLLFLAAAEVEKGMAAMSEKYNETGRELYMDAGGREND